MARLVIVTTGGSQQDYRAFRSLLMRSVESVQILPGRRRLRAEFASADDVSNFMLVLVTWLGERPQMAFHLITEGGEIVLDGDASPTLVAQAVGDLVGQRHEADEVLPSGVLGAPRVQSEIAWPGPVPVDSVLKAAIGLAIHDHLKHARAASTMLAPVTIYLDDASGSSRVEQAVRELAAAFEAEAVDWEPAIRGSWFRKLFLRGKELANTQIAQEIGSEVRRAVELHGLHLAQAEVDEKKAAAVSNLIQALPEQGNAAIMIGSILLLKVEGALVVRELTQKELAHLERNPALFKEPTALLAALQRASCNAPQGLGDALRAGPGSLELPE
jgi:hypothetical protein